MKMRRMRIISRWLTDGARRSRGFTLIELLVVIIIIAMLAAIAIPTYLGQRDKAQDTAAYTLVRNGLTVVQSAVVETGDYAALTVAMLDGIESTIHWVQGTADLVVVGSNPSINMTNVLAEAKLKQVAFYVDPVNRQRIDLLSKSASGNWYGVQIDGININDTAYIKIKIVDGAAQEGW
jgi:prepilin-type N-terminal cleavage/methylation domain-containing protein